MKKKVLGLIDGQSGNIGSIKKAIKDLRYFFSGILNFQKGINIINTRPILNDAINIGGTELLRANFATGKALPCAAIIKNNINKCLIGKIYPIVNGSVIGLSDELYQVVFILVYSLIESIPASFP